VTTSRPRRTDRRRKPNPLYGVTYIDYKDVDLLRRFISDRGKIRSRRSRSTSL
jgi:small subunit ribosomal protein S18